MARGIAYLLQSSRHFIVVAFAAILVAPAGDLLGDLVPVLDLAV
jgi:hypothetical protein